MAPLIEPDAVEFLAALVAGVDGVRRELVDVDVLPVRPTRAGQSGPWVLAVPRVEWVIFPKGL